jgi:hypothetical protein
MNDVRVAAGSRSATPTAFRTPLYTGGALSKSTAGAFLASAFASLESESRRTGSASPHSRLNKDATPAGSSKSLSVLESHSVSICEQRRAQARAHYERKQQQNASAFPPGPPTTFCPRTWRRSAAAASSAAISFSTVFLTGSLGFFAFLSLPLGGIFLFRREPATRTSSG